MGTCVRVRVEHINTVLENNCKRSDTYLWDKDIGIISQKIGKSNGSTNEKDWAKYCII